MFMATLIQFESSVVAPRPRRMNLLFSADPTAPATFREDDNSPRQTFEPASRTQWLLAGGALLVFLALGIGHSMTLRPWWDEGLFADIALNFRNFGHLGSSVWDPHGWHYLPGVHQYT